MSGYKGPGFGGGGRSRYERRFWDGPKKVGFGVDRVMKHLDAPNPSVVEGVFARWPELVGDVISEHTRPARITDGELVIEAESAAWVSELRWMSDEILNQIRTKLATEEVTSVVVVLAKPS